MSKSPERDKNSNPKIKKIKLEPDYIILSSRGIQMLNEIKPSDWEKCIEKYIDFAIDSKYFEKWDKKHPNELPNRDTFLKMIGIVYFVGSTVNKNIKHEKIISYIKNNDEDVICFAPFGKYIKTVGDILVVIEEFGYNEGGRIENNFGGVENMEYIMLENKTILNITF